MISLKGKVAIVTGGTKGIGKGIADSLSSYGTKVVVCATSKKRTKHHFIQADVCRPEDAERVVKETLKKFGRLDILVNNAGIYPFVPFPQMTFDQWQKVMDTNLNGVFHFTKAVLPHMMKKKYGKIINIASIAGVVVGFPALVHYSTTKAGLMGFTRAAALDLAPYKINVNAIAPGAIRTPGVKKGLDAKALEKLTHIIPEGKLGAAADIGETAAFLAADASQYITGQTIIVDGGFTDV
ncbi:MAG: SDR family NAD(P)-dependent oxidoreductase [Candidatus Diapherotrites archaeon]|nr:SDR family NAD(P)-dependent oxidoreductase [Candidatus Diapherotrites archaeon]MDZ4256851.1 SDR family NAD(P)-dependent oxidoreductase [archaeon]